MWNLWLDDVRDCPRGWLHSKSVNAAIALIEENGLPGYASLDHDLGDYAWDGGDGINLIDYMVANECFPTQGIRVHSSNPVGVKRMLASIDTYAVYRFRGLNHRGNQHFDWPPALMSQ